MLSAILYAHDQGIIHRDLKYALLFVCSSAQPLISFQYTFRRSDNIYYKYDRKDFRRMEKDEADKIKSRDKSWVILGDFGL